MSIIKNNLDTFIAKVMKEQDNSKLKVLRLIKSEYQKFETSGADKKLDDSNEIKILKKMQKQWKEELDILTKAGRDNTSLKEELEYLESFLPKEMTEAEQKSAAKHVIMKYLIGFPLEERQSMKHLGAIMKIMNKEYPMINGKIVSEVFKGIIA